MRLKNYFPCFFVFLICFVITLFVLFFFSYYKFENEQNRINPVVRTKNGQIRGHQVNVLNKDVYEFVGIRYAQPPIGDLRFKKPVAVANWTDVYDATETRNICWQANSSKYNREHMNEDCLFLNIWSSNLQTLKPVLFWIHGGAFIMGSSFSESINGSALATYHVVIVTINYRLGLFGFLYGGSEDAPGNAGLYDQLLALKWINENIKSFGGDPDQITISGESAGAISVGLHLLSDMSKGLFKRAIIQSGAPYFPKNYGPTNEEYLNIAKSFSRELGCENESWMKCLKELNASDIHDKVNPFLFRNPIIDGEFCTQTAQQTFELGQFNSDVQILTGVMLDEGTAFLLSYFQLTQKDPDANYTKDQLKQLLNYLVEHDLLLIHVDVKDAFDFYMSNENESDQTSLKKAFSDIIGDPLLVCPTIFFAQKFTELNNTLKEKVYFYRFSHKLTGNSNLNGNDWLGYYHAQDVPIVFGKAVIDQSSYSHQDYQFSLLIMILWTNFIKNG